MQDDFIDPAGDSPVTLPNYMVEDIARCVEQRSFSAEMFAHAQLVGASFVKLMRISTAPDPK